MTVKILCVDDEPDFEMLISQVFRHAVRDREYEFLFAKNGFEAIEILKKDPDIIVVITDINMPEMDGLTLIEKLKELGRISKAIVLSAYGDMEKIRRAMNRGAFDFLNKPIDFKDLDITIRKTIEHVRQLKEVILMKEEKIKADLANKTKTALLRNLSHELRTPLTGILGITQMLKQNPDATLEMKDEFEKIHFSGEKMLYTVTNLLHLVDLEIEQEKIIYETVSIQKLLDEISPAVHKLMNQNNNVFEVFLHDNISEIKTDYHKLRSSLFYLLDNASKFTRNGKVELIIRQDEKAQSGIKFEVIDTGVGISEEGQRQIFSVFFQADSSSSRKAGGIGLGLFLVKSFVEMLGGSIDVKSSLGRGSTFTIRLPSTLCALFLSRILLSSFFYVI